ncbi:MAG: hypothetical protein EA386_04055 [Rhodobacteraceae bacterium]|nr:MAG: hypothetical protein EA386_04055 [Paracoccaceae bacterium]
MRKTIVAAFALLVSASLATAEADDAQAVECLRANIPVSAIDFGPAVVDDREIAVRVANETQLTLGGVWISYAIWADDRPQPLYSASIRPAATIGGGLLPGETMVARDFHFMSDREKEIAREAQTLRLTLEVENAADTQMNGFLLHPRMGSWTDQTTEAQCAAREP